MKYNVSVYTTGIRILSISDERRMDEEHYACYDFYLHAKIRHLCYIKFQKDP